MNSMSDSVSIRVAVEGYDEFKQKITEVNASANLLKSELAKVESEYRGNANSMDALEKKGDVLARMYSNQSEKVSTLKEAVEKANQAQRLYSYQAEQSSAKLERAKAKLDDLKNSTKDTSTQQEKLTSEIKKHEQAMSEAQKYQEAAQKGVNNWQRSLNYAERDLNNLNGKIEDNAKYLDEAKKSVDGHATSIDEYGKKAKKSSDITQTAIQTLAGALAAAGVAKAINEIVDAIKECVSASIEFESAITGVYKTVEGTPEQLAAIADGIKKMSTEIPATTTEIAAVAEAAGQLGIAADDVLSFSRVMLDLGESTNLTADEAATALARFANITGTAADDYERLGSVIVGLGNNFATTEAEITEMATRLASAGTLAGLTESQIMALATAMSSVGIEAEAGGTAMTQTLTAIEKAVADGGKKLEEFARIAGMSASGFANTWESDAITAVQAFIAGLGGLDEQGESATLVLDELGLSGVRQSNMLKSLALASETLTDAVATANRAWEENTALVEEASKRYDTTEAKMAMLENGFTNVKAAIGDSLSPALGELAEAGANGFSWAAEFISNNPWLVQAITGVITALGILVGGAMGLLALQTVISTLTPLIAAFNAVLAANPVLAVAAAVAGLTVAIGSFVASAKSAAGETDELNATEVELEAAAKSADEALKGLSGSAEETADVMANLSERSKELSNASAELSESQDNLSAALDEQQEKGSLSLNTILGLIDAGYAAALAIDTETGAVTLNKDAYIAIAQAKIEAQIQTLEAERTSIAAAIAMREEAVAATDASVGYLEKARAARAAKAAEENLDLKNQLTSYDAQIAALKASKNALSSYTGAVVTHARTTSTASKQVKTQAEQDLAAYKNLRAALDHDKAMDELGEEEYYKRLTELRDEYLTDDDNLDEYRKVNEQIHKYDVELVGEQEKLWDEQSEAMLKEWEENLRGLAGEYDAQMQDIQGKIDDVKKQQEEMRSKLSGYGDLFTIEDDQMSLESIQGQIDALNTYEDTLNRLKERGVSDGLLNEVLGMDIDDATAYGEELLGLSDDQWSEYNALWEEKQQRAIEIATQFYQDELDTLQTEYDEKLAEALDALKDTAFESGQDTAQGLINGLSDKEDELYRKARSIADEVSSILSSAWGSRGDIDGSHAGGLTYVPYDGYVAELHEGERVLTAEEAKAYVLRSTPSNLEAPQRDNSNEMLASALVNGVAGAVSQIPVGQTGGEIHIHVDLNKKEIASAVYDPLKDIKRQRGD